ncbi:phosphoribosylanthranilate isomerase [Anatilimnocola floriformis]|uniref:phosphoribosylanthranilate isomerase n=1 Tax=Anatilimnocola floriformis TaxID=2948575 RepID=UPI0020C3A7E8|nr:phosphoribosylanthranilate isomerase [Anatilimnocola floriformis]
MRIKICGITNRDDATTAIEAGADALGFNFYPKSPRSISLATLQQIGGNLAVNKVGVFVNHADPLQVAIDGGLDTIQLHGDETPQELVEIVNGAQSQGKQVWRAFRCKENSLADVAEYLERCESLGALPAAVLLDAYAPDAFGGTGKVVDWNSVREQRRLLRELPLILAGGLTPENIAEAIRTAQPDGVDVASGVESSPGKKDAAKVRDFVAAAKLAFTEITGQS